MAAESSAQKFKFAGTRSRVNLTIEYFAARREQITFPFGSSLEVTKLLLVYSQVVASWQSSLNTAHFNQGAIDRYHVDNMEFLKIYRPHPGRRS